MDAQLQNYLSQVASLPHEEQAEILKLLQDLDSATKREEAQSEFLKFVRQMWPCLLYTSPSPRDATLSRMPSSA